MKKNIWIGAIALLLLIIGVIIELSGGNMFSTGEYVLNYFSAGEFACGIFSGGIFAAGIFSIGIFSVGIFSIGIFNISIFSIGIFVIAWRKNLPKVFKETLETSISNFTAAK